MLADRRARFEMPRGDVLDRPRVSHNGLPDPAAAGRPLCGESHDGEVARLQRAARRLEDLRFTEAELPAALAADQVLLAVDRFALTANNITYALTGDMLGYWTFFPADDGWGRIP